MRVLVTGGTGFVGSHTVAALIENGHDVRLLVRSPDRIAPALEPLGVGKVDSIVGDITDANAGERAMKGCEAVRHAGPPNTRVPPRLGSILRRTTLPPTRYRARVRQTRRTRRRGPVQRIASPVDRPIVQYSPQNHTQNLSIAVTTTLRCPIDEQQQFLYPTPQLAFHGLPP